MTNKSITNEDYFNFMQILDRIQDDARAKYGKNIIEKWRARRQKAIGYGTSEYSLYNDTMAL